MSTTTHDVGQRRIVIDHIGCSGDLKEFYKSVIV